MIRPLILCLALTACTTRPPVTFEWMVHSGPTMVMRDKGSCVIVTPREITYAALGVAVRQCFEEGR